MSILNDDGDDSYCGDNSKDEHIQKSQTTCIVNNGMSIENYGSYKRLL